MIDTLELAGCRVYLLEFAVGDRCSGQREGEKRAVREIVESVFGDNAVLSHRPVGSPVVEGCNVEISVSHCRGVAAVAVNTDSQRIGIDIEEFRDALKKVAKKYLSPAEMERCTAPCQLLTAWTVKEALYKAAGVSGVNFANGVRLPLPESDTGEVDTPSGVKRFKVMSVDWRGRRLSIAIPCAHSFIP